MRPLLRRVALYLTPLFAASFHSVQRPRLPHTQNDGSSRSPQDWLNRPSRCKVVSSPTIGSLLSRGPGHSSLIVEERLARARRRGVGRAYIARCVSFQSDDCARKRPSFTVSAHLPSSTLTRLILSLYFAINPAFEKLTITRVFILQTQVVLFTPSTGSDSSLRSYIYHLYSASTWSVLL